MPAVRKILVISLICFALISNSGALYAGGIPVFQYNQSVSYSSGGYYIGVSPYNTWSETYRYSDEWSAVYYYQYLWTSQSYVGTDYYISRVSITAWNQNGYNTGGAVYVQCSNDGVNWSSPAQTSLPSGGTVLTTTITIPASKQIKMGLVAIGYNVSNFINYGSLSVTNLEMSLAGADQGTAEAARTAANNASTYSQQAKTSADAAATNATNAFNAVSNANGNTITAVRDSSGTVLSEARQAKSEAQAANTKLDSIQTAVTNIQNNIGADISPPTVKIRTVSGAAATSAGSIQAYLDISDNVSSSFTYSLDGATYNAVPVNRVISLPVSVPGSNIIQVWIKDQAGNIGASSISIRKL